MRGVRSELGEADTVIITKKKVDITLVRSELGEADTPKKEATGHFIAPN